MGKDLEKVAHDIRGDLLHYVARGIDEVAALVESPIERALFWALVYQSAYNQSPRAHKTKGESPFMELRAEACEFALLPQSKVLLDGRSCRVDFEVVVSKPDRGALFFAIECDGHDFHERTKEQAARDRKRDRNLQALGYRVLRFTGSEIYESPKKVANEILDFINEAYDREVSK